MPRHLYAPSLLRTGSLTFADAVILIALVSLLGFGAALALHAPHAIRGPQISLELATLPWYALLSLPRMKTLDLPFAGLALIWNSMMSWSGGWFFLMAAEIFHVGARDFRLPGLGSYLQVAANRGSLGAVAAGLGTLTAVIIALDQLVWRPLLAWADRFKVETVQGEEPPRSWFLDLISR